MKVNIRNEQCAIGCNVELTSSHIILHQDLRGAHTKRQRLRHFEVLTLGLERQNAFQWDLAAAAAAWCPVCSYPYWLSNCNTSDKWNIAKKWGARWTAGKHTSNIYRFRNLNIFTRYFIQPCPKDGSETLSAPFVSVGIGYFLVIQNSSTIRSLKANLGHFMKLIFEQLLHGCVNKGKCTTGSMKILL